MVRALTVLAAAIVAAACGPLELEPDPLVAPARDGSVITDAGPPRDAGPVAPEDVTSDGCVDRSDLDFVQEEWGEPNSMADIDDNGTVDVVDLNRVLAAWGTGCPDAGVSDAS